MSTTSVISVVIMATFFAGLQSSCGFQWIKHPGLSVSITYPDQKSITLRWEWKLGKNEEFRDAEITRYKAIDKNNTKQKISSCYKFFNRTNSWNDLFYKSSCQAGKPGVINEYVQLEIEDVTKQSFSFFQRPPEVDVLTFNYTFECLVKIIYDDKFLNPALYPKATKLIVYMRPTIKTTPENIYIDSLYKDVTLNCTAEGNPKPTIIWEHKHPSGAVRTFKGEELTISKAYTDPFQLSDIGLYTCQATNNVGNASSVAVVQYTVCGSGCSTDDGISIEMTQLTYTFYHNYRYSSKYIKLKDAVEQDCFNQYFKAAQKIFSCVVTGFRKGSVIVDLTITYPSDPRKPLQTAISTGMFAGQRVKTSFNSKYSGEREDEIKKLDTNNSTAGEPHSSSSSTSRVSVIVLGVFLAVSLVGNLIFIVYFIWKQTKERTTKQARSINNQGRLYMNNNNVDFQDQSSNTFAFQNQASTNRIQHAESIISQEQHQPIHPVNQSSENNITYQTQATANAVQPIISDEQYEIAPLENQHAQINLALQGQGTTSGVQYRQSVTSRGQEQIPQEYEPIQDQAPDSALQSTEIIINQRHNLPIQPGYQSVQNHIDIYSSLSPKTKLPPTPAFLTNSGPYQDLQGTPQPYQSLDSSKAL